MDYLARRTIGFLVAQRGVEDRELVGPRQALEDAGARTLLIAPGSTKVETVKDGVPFALHPVDLTLRDAVASALLGYDALVLPDGETGSTALRNEPTIRQLVSAFALSGRPVGAFGHAVWSLLDADLVAGRDVTSHPSLRRAVEAAGGRWHDRRVVVDANVITSRARHDVEAFNVQLLAYLDR